MFLLIFLYWTWRRWFGVVYSTVEFNDFIILDDWVFYSRLIYVFLSEGEDVSSFRRMLWFIRRLKRSWDNKYGGRDVVLGDGPVLARVFYWVTGVDGVIGWIYTGCPRLPWFCQIYKVVGKFELCLWYCCILFCMEQINKFITECNEVIIYYT